MKYEIPCKNVRIVGSGECFLQFVKLQRSECCSVSSLFSSLVVVNLMISVMVLLGTKIFRQLIFDLYFIFILNINVDFFFIFCELFLFLMTVVIGGA